MVRVELGAAPVGIAFVRVAVVAPLSHPHGLSDPASERASMSAEVMFFGAISAVGPETSLCVAPEPPRVQSVQFPIALP